jgi:uncharacterized membrane protein
MTTKRLFSIGIIVCTILASAVLYPALPDRVASHWNASGVVNGTMPRLWSVLIVPLLMLFFTGLFWSLPLLDPIKKNARDLQDRSEEFLVILLLFFAYVHALTLGFNLGHHIDIVRWMIPGFAMLFYEIGRLMQDAKQNWFFGIRTPWTMSDETVWTEVHKKGATGFKAAALVSLIGIITPTAWSIWFVLVPILAVSLYCLVDSYILFQKRHPR